MKQSNYQIRSVAQSCPTLCDPMNCSTPGLPVHHQLLELAQIHVHQVSDAIRPTHALLSLFPLAFNLSLQTLTRWNFVCKVITLLFNMLSRLVIAFLPRSKCLLISWLQSPPAVILEPPKNTVCHCFPISFP